MWDNLPSASYQKDKSKQSFSSDINAATIGFYLNIKAHYIAKQTTTLSSLQEVLYKVEKLEK